MFVKNKNKERTILFV